MRLKARAAAAAEGRAICVGARAHRHRYRSRSVASQECTPASANARQRHGLTAAEEAFEGARRLLPPARFVNAVAAAGLRKAAMPGVRRSRGHDISTPESSSSFEPTC